MADGLGAILGGGFGATIGKAVVQLELETTKYMAEMRAAQAETTASTKTMATGMAGLGTAGLTAFGLIGAASIKLAIDFDRSFTRIAAISNTSAGAIEGMKEQVLALAGETAQSPTELADALFFLASAGLDASEVMPALEASAKASAVGLGETADVANIVASALNAYSGSGLTAAKATDVLVAAVREGRAEPEEFATALGRILPIASTVGVTFDQVAASMATLSNIGLDVNEATTAMRGVLQALAAPGKQAAEALDSLGLSSQQLLDEISEHGIIGAIRTLDAAAKAQTTTQAGYNSVLREIIPNIRSLTGVFGLTVQEGEKVDSIFKRILDSTGATGEAFQTTAESEAFQLQKAMNDLVVAGTKLGTAVLPTLATGLKFLADNVTLLVTAFGAWLIVTKGLPLVLTAVQAGTAALAGLFPTLSNNLMAIGGAANFAKSAMMGLTTVLTIGVTAVLVALPALVDNFSISLTKLAKDSGFTAGFLEDLDSQLSLTSNLFNNVSFSGFISMLDGTRDQVQAVTEALIPLYTNLQSMGLSASSAEDFLGTFTSTMNEATGPAIAEMTAKIEDQITLISALGESLGQGEIDIGIFTDRMVALGFSTSEATALADAALDKYGKSVSKTGRIVRNFGDMSDEEFKDFTEGVEESVEVTIGEFEKMSDAFDTTPNELQKQLRLAVQIARREQADLREIFRSKDLTGAQKEALAEMPANMRHAWAEGGKAAKNQIERDAVTLKNLNDRTFQQITRSGAEKAKEGGKGIGGGLMSGAVAGVVEGAPALSTATRNAVRQAITAGKSEAGAASPSKEMAKLGVDMMVGLANGISDTEQKAIDAARTAIEKVVDKVSSELDKIKGKASSFADSIRSGFSGFSDIAGAFESREGWTSLSTVIQGQVTGATQLANVLEALKRQGAGQALLSQVAGAGAGFGQTLLQGGPAQINEANEALKTIAELSRQTGKALSESFFGDRIDKVERKLDQLHEDLRELAGYERQGHSHDIVMNGEKVAEGVRKELISTGGRNPDIFGGRA
jgi:TP901 family phage tail tape measure protein